MLSQDELYDSSHGCNTLNRQYSSLDLAQSAISLSMASFKTSATTDGSFIGEGSRKGSSLGKAASNCAFPGLEPDQHCHSVVATVLKRKYKLDPIQNHINGHFIRSIYVYVYKL